MTTRHFVQVAALLALVIAASPIDAQDARPSQGATRRVIQSDVAEIAPAYASLRDRVWQADAVIRGRVLDDGRPVVPEGVPPGVGALVSTEFRIQTLEVYKAHEDADAIGTVVRVMQTGGEAIVGDVIMKTTSGPHLLVSGGEFLVFLKYDAGQHRFWTVTGDTFPIVDGRIKVDRAHEQPYAAALDGVLSSDSQGALWVAVRSAVLGPDDSHLPQRPPLPPPPSPPPPRR